MIGGSGFIGTHTCFELKQNLDVNITIIDIKPPSVNNVDYIKADVTDYKQVLESLSSEFDVVYMFAAISDSTENFKEPLTAVNNNIVSLANVLQAMHVYEIPKIIFSSTVWVYSVANEIDVNEKTQLPITNSNHIYTTSKLTCESIIRNYSVMFNINYIIFRYGIAYGPGCHPDTIISKFISNALCDTPLTITGNGNIYRNFLNVVDHARGNRMALETEHVNEIINLEGPTKVTLTNVADTVKMLHEGPVTINYTDTRPGDYVGKNVCNSKAKKLLGWEPTIDFTTGMKRMYEHKKQQNINHCTAC